MPEPREYRWWHGIMERLLGHMQAEGKENEVKDGNTARLLETASASGAAAGALKGGDEGQEVEGKPPSKWALHCHATLGAVSAAAVLKASS